jgi:signal transduction histidine kinase
MDERYTNARSYRIVIGALSVFVLFALWQIVNHVVLMDLLRLPMFTYHAVSLGAETVLAAGLLVFVAQALIRKNSQLAEKSRRLEELDRQKNMLTTALVHDLRQPLTGLLSGLISVLQHGRLDNATREMLHLVQLGAGNLQAMVTDLLDVAALEAGKQIIRREAVDPADFISAGVQDVGLIALDREVDLYLDVPDDLPAVNGDAPKLRRVVMNLVDNAVKFTPSYGTVSVKAWDDPEHGRILVSVRDTGRGIPDEFHDCIFEKFAVLDSGRSEGRRPSGLGLTFCKMIVEAHGGGIWVESEVGRGSTFAFSLPAASEMTRCDCAVAGEGVILAE